MRTRQGTKRGPVSLHRLSQNEGGRKGGSRQDRLVWNVGGNWFSRVHRKERGKSSLISLPEKWAPSFFSVVVRGADLRSAGHTRAPLWFAAYPCEVAILVIRLFRSCVARSALRGPGRRTSDSEGPWQHVVCRRVVPIRCESDVPRRCIYVGPFVCICARGRGPGRSTAFDSSLSLLSLASSFGSREAARCGPICGYAL